MTNIARMLTTTFASFACVLTVMSCSQSTKLDLKSLPTIKADGAHQFNIETKNSLPYEVPAGRGFLLDTSAYKKEYAQAESITPDVAVSRVVRLDPVASTKAGPESVNLVPGRDLYQVCPESGLRSGDKFTVTIGEEVTDWGHYNFSPRWTAFVNVK